MSTSSFSELEESFRAYAEYLRTVSVPDQVIDHYNAHLHAANVVVDTLAHESTRVTIALGDRKSVVKQW